MSNRGSRPDFATVCERVTPRVFNRFFLARGFEEGVAAEDLFCLGERAVGDCDLAADTLVYAKACSAKVHALGCD